MSGKRIRISHLLHPGTGKAVIVPVDHGIVLGSVPGLADPLAVIRRLDELNVEGVLLGAGLTKISVGIFERRDAPARILTVDYSIFGSVPGRIEVVSETEMLASVEFALRYDFDCLKAALIWGLEREKQVKNVGLIGRLAEECDRCGLPLMVEPVLWGEQVPAEMKNDPQTIEHAARIALEIGADLLKVPYTGVAESFAEMVARLSVPVLVLGGPKMGTLRDVLLIARDSIRAGACGVVFGRNVWQHPAMDAVIRALQEVVHRDADVDDAMAKAGL
jgi:class I fructose-bisphosphate aldolase